MQHSGAGGPADHDTGDNDATRRLDTRPAADAGGDVEGLLAPGTLIGRYRIESTLGQGGMGAVYRAEQLEPVRRTVALKLLRGQRFDTRQRAFFEIERQTLAQMQHPAIAQIFDAGTTPDGVPFFAMECIQGEPITQACEHLGLGLEARLDLFAQVCDGVQHAHQKGVIHRDLKPANILVTRIDGRPRPRIIDFGIATATTRVGATRQSVPERAGTPDYMSPEQCLGDLQAIDTRSDVYSLGVVLFELLTGERPGLATASDRTARPSATTVRPPSALVRAGAGGALAARLRHRRGRLHELDQVVLKAIDPDRARRYDSAGEFGDDVRRFLAQQPLRAIAPTRRYLTGKFVRRHRLGLAAASAVVVALVAGLAVSLYGLEQAQTQRRLAEQRGQELEQVVAFQQATLRDIDVQAMGQGVLAEQRAQLGRHAEGAALVARFDAVAAALSGTDLARSVLDRFVLSRAEQAIERDFGDQPALAAGLRHGIGEVFFAIGQYERAEQAFAAALAARPAADGPARRDEIDSRANLALALERQGRHDDARVAAQQARDLAVAHLAPDDPVRDQADLALAQVHTALGEFAAARDLQRAVIDRLAARGAADADGTGAEADARAAALATARNNLGITLARLGDFPGARIEFESLLELRRRQLGPGHPDTVSTLSNLGAVLGTLGDHEAALAASSEAYRLRRQASGDEHPSTLNELNNIGSSLVQLGRFDEAYRTLVEVVAIRTRVLGAEHPQTLRSQQNLSSVLERLGRSDEAMAQAQAVLAARRRTLGPDHADTLRSQESLASLYQRADRPLLAEREARAVLAARLRVLGPGHPETGLAQFLLADILEGSGRPADGRDLLVELMALQQAAGGTDEVLLNRAALRLYRLQLQLGEPAQAQVLRQTWLEPLLAREPGGLPSGLRQLRGEVESALAPVAAPDGQSPAD
jgi:non-specific serine/threonine protein kinase/serine/threonine-protein kinase